MAEDIYAKEAEERWGDTDAYKESQRRSAGYSQEDIDKAGRAMQDATNLVIAAMRNGKSADSDEAIAGAEAHRKSISDWWYECNHEMHTGLANMYVQDPRFTEFYEKQQPGLAKFMHDAIFANALKHS